MSNTWEHIITPLAIMNVQRIITKRQSITRTKSTRRRQTMPTSLMGHTQQALHHDVEVAKLRAERCDSDTSTASEQEAHNKAA